MKSCTSIKSSLFEQFPPVIQKAEDIEQTDTNVQSTCTDTEETENHMKYNLSLLLAENEAEVQRDRGDGARQMTQAHGESHD